MAIVGELGASFVTLTLEMAPYLLLGFIIAGIIKVYLPQNFVNNYMGHHNKHGAVNAALLGVPLPLCSCGVIPTGISFYKNGAGKGASVSFLISTPQTGVDSILVTGSLLTFPFALLRPIIAFVTGVLGGWLTDKVAKDDQHNWQAEVKRKSTVKKNRFEETIYYALDEFLMDISKWLLIGLAIAALIATFVPDNFFAGTVGQGWTGMLLILVASLPLYVCATSSVPIAAALMLKGLSPGAALVFLMAGPATNAATMTVIKQTLGSRVLVTYMFSIIAGALLSGFVIDNLLPVEWFELGAMSAHGHEHYAIPIWLEVSSTLILGGAMLRGYIKKLIPAFMRMKNKNKTMEKLELNVTGMGCKSCSGKIEEGLLKFENVKIVTANHETNSVVVEGKGVDKDDVVSKITELGYNVND